MKINVTKLKARKTRKLKARTANAGPRRSSAKAGKVLTTRIAIDTHGEIR